MRKQHLITVFVLVCGLSTLLGQEILTRTANDGNLVLQDIPEIPEDVVRELNRYQNVRSASFSDWAGDASGIYVSTRFGDVTQIHRVDQPAGARHQLTFFDEPVRSIARRKEHDTLAFTMDEGGNEFSQIYLLTPKTGEARLLTDGKSRNGSLSWSPDGKRLAYRSTRRNDVSNDVWLLDPDRPEAARIILESPDGSHWAPAAWKNDGTSLLVQQYISIKDSRIHLVDLSTGEGRPVEAGTDDAPSVNDAVAFDKSSEGFFFITNQHSEFNQLAHRRFDDAAIRILTPDIPWNVGGAVISDDHSRLAFTTNEDGLDVLYLLDTASFNYVKVDGIPVGLVRKMDFSPDGRRLGMTLNTPQTPSDSFTLSLGAGPLDYGELTRWTFSEIGGLDVSAFVIPELIRYESFDGRKIPAFVYTPPGEGPFPVIISIHGGPESQYRPSFSSTFQLWIEKLGAAVIAPNVRGSNGYGKEYVNLDNDYKREDSVKDIGALLDWIATQPALDASRVAVYGGSYGGYMVLASSAHYSDRLSAAVDIVGISNFVTFLENTQPYRQDLRRAEYGDERIPEMRAFLEKISPNRHVDKIDLPMLVVQGENDPRVPVTEAEQIVQALRDNGKTVWYMNALNEGHGYAKKENRDVFEQTVVLFFQKYLLPDERTE